MSTGPRTDNEMLISQTPQKHLDDEPSPGDSNMDCTTDGGEELSLDSILTLYSQPINEEQAWAVCYQCCRTLVQKHRRRNSKLPVASALDPARRIEGAGDVKIQKDGTVKLRSQVDPDKHGLPHTSRELIESLGIMIYKALDYGLKEHEERELSPPLEQLIDLMTNITEADSDPCPDEGYEAFEEEEEEEGDEPQDLCNVRGYRDILGLCTSHLPSPSDAPTHYQAVCRALYTEARELGSFLEKIHSAKENLRKMGSETREEPIRDLNELQNADWARCWVQVMRDLRDGVKLKKVQERQYNPLPIEYQLTPYEMLMDDIRSKRYKLRKVMVNGDIPPKLKKSAHEVILEFIRSRPPLNPVAARKLKPYPERPPSLHERILEGIKAERKLRPVSPDMIRRHRLGAGKSISTPQDLYRSSDASSPNAPRKLAISSFALSNGVTPTQSQSNGVGVAPALSQRKRLQAPTLSELDSSDSEEDPFRRSPSSSSMSASMVDTSPESVLGKKTPPNFLPISSTPQPDRRLAPPRRHSIEKETPTTVRPFQALSRNSSKSLLPMDSNTKVETPSGVQPKRSLKPNMTLKEEFCYPVESLALTVEEVMHIRQVLVKAELEKFQQYKEVYTSLKKGKVCFTCRTKRFSLFTWSYTCQFCKRPVCSQCCTKMRLPSKPYATLPIYSLGSSTLPREEAPPTPAPEKSSASSSSGHHRPNLHRTVSRLSKHGDRSSRPGELELPRELTEDWRSMEVCVDCKKFISEIISSSKRSLSLATKRARLQRKTQSFHLSSPKGAAAFWPRERTIKEV